MRILFLALELPYPPDSGGRIRTFNMLKQIARRHEVTLVSFGDASDASALTTLRALCSDVIAVQCPKTAQRHLIHKLRELPVRYPVSLETYRSVEMTETIRSLVSDGSCEIAHIDFIHMAQYAEVLKPLPLVLTHHNIEGQVLQRELDLLSDGSLIQRWATKLENNRWVRFEIDASRKADAIVAVSQEDAEYFRGRIDETPTFIVPNGVDTNYYQYTNSTNIEETMLYTGRMDYGPNVDAMIWFCQEIFPIIYQKKPELKLKIVGRDPVPEVLALEEIDGITVIGGVKDIRPFFQQAKLYVVPLRYGGGTRLKILEAMAMGVPIVSTSLGCEGLELVHGNDLLVADEPSGFALSVFDLCNSADLRSSLAVCSRKIVEEKYDWKNLAKEQENAYRAAFVGHG